MRKRILSVFMTLVMLLSLMPVMAKAETNGQCGDNLTWTLDDNGTLTISGTGDMWNWESTSSPWYGKTNIRNIKISNGVTGIGSYAFEGCSSLTGISLPEGLMSIGEGVFKHCSGLINVGLPEGLTSIEGDAFRYCSSLASISLPESLTSVGHDAFRYCSSLTDISLPEGLTNIGSGAFAYCSGLTNISLPKGLISIDIGLFENCENLISISLPEGLTTIGSGAFANCSSLTNISLPKGLTSIEYGTFGYCSSLKSISLPENVTSIGDLAFNECSGLTSISIPERVTSIGWDAFLHCRRLTDVYYGGSKEQWASISIGEDNEDLTNAAIHYNSTMPDGTADYESEILNYSEIDGKYIINSIAGNNTDADISCILYSAVYAADGTLKACGTVRADIAPKDDTDVDVAVPCAIERGDTIKTFMWSENMTALSNAAKFTVE